MAVGVELVVVRSVKAQHVAHDIHEPNDHFKIYLRITSEAGNTEVSFIGRRLLTMRTSCADRLAYAQGQQSCGGG